MTYVYLIFGSIFLGLIIRLIKYRTLNEPAIKTDLTVPTPSEVMPNKNSSHDKIIDMESIMLAASSLKSSLKRSALPMVAGGFRPTGDLTESWFGKTYLSKENEIQPVDQNGKPLLSLAQIYFPNNYDLPKALEGLKAITIFIAEKLGEPFGENNDWYVVREYSNADQLIRNDSLTIKLFVKPFPIKFEECVDDYPKWDSDDMPFSVADEFLKLEKLAGDNLFHDELTMNFSDHKLGGYPSYCQSGIDPGEGFEFAFQISSDSKLGLNVVDSGSLMFWRNPTTKQWFLYYDFY